MSKIKKENQILIMLAFFSISMGLWENFRQLWLQDNNFSATDISNIISIGTLVSVLGILLVGFRYIVRYLGESVGVFLCGLMYNIGLRYMFGLSALFIAIQIGLAYYLIYLRRKENNKIKE